MWFLKADEEIVGHVSLQSINRMMGTAEIGYTVAPTARIKGFATTAVRALTEKVFAETKLRKLLAYVHEDNQPWRRILERFG